MDPDAAAILGLISNMMHDMKKEGDIVRVSHPMGNLFPSIPRPQTMSRWVNVIVSWSRLDLSHVNFEHIHCPAFEATDILGSTQQGWLVWERLQNTSKTYDAHTTTLTLSYSTLTWQKEMRKESIIIKGELILCLRPDIWWAWNISFVEMKTMPVKSIWKSLAQEACRRSRVSRLTMDRVLYAGDRILDTGDIVGWMDRIFSDHPWRNP